MCLGASSVSNQALLEYEVAQKFSTGDNPNGYILEEVTIDIEDAPNNKNDFSLTLKKSGTNPGNTIATLQNPSNIGTGTQSFAAPSNTPLTANTDYFIVAKYTGSGIPHLERTDSDDEDSGKASGWDIDDRYRYKTTSGNSWVAQSSGYALKMAIKGSAAALGIPDTPELKDLSLIHISEPTRTY